MEIHGDNFSVYIHTNKINGKKYIGITKQKPETRWNYGNGYIANNHFYNAIKKYGWDEGFEHEIVASNLTQQEAKNFEILLIREFDTIDNSKGYNHSKGGDGCMGMTGKKAYWYGKKLSKEHRQKISNSHKGKTVSAKTRKKLSDSHKGEKAYFYGRPFTEEHRKNISLYHADFSLEKNPCARAVNQYDKNGNFIRRWACMQQASNELNIGNTHISSCCRGKRKSSGGYVWKYADEVIK